MNQNEVDNKQWTLLVICFTLVYCLAYSYTLMMEATYSFETSVDFQPTIWSIIPEDRLKNRNMVLKLARMEAISWLQ